MHVLVSPAMINSPFIASVGDTSASERAAVTQAYAVYAWTIGQAALIGGVEAEEGIESYEHVRSESTISSLVAARSSSIALFASLCLHQSVTALIRTRLDGKGTYKLGVDTRDPARVLLMPLSTLTTHPSLSPARRMLDRPFRTVETALDE